MFGVNISSSKVLIRSYVHYYYNVVCSLWIYPRLYFQDRKRLGVNMNKGEGFYMYNFWL